MQKKETYPGLDGKFLLNMPLLNMINVLGYNERIFYIFLIKMKIVEFFKALAFVYEIF
jgi:hypothetical protein